MRVFLSALILLGLFNFANAQVISEKASCANPIPIQFTVNVLTPYNGEAIQCNGDCNATVEVTVTGGGGGPYGFEMFDGTLTTTQAADAPGGGTVATFTGLCADNYNFTVIDSAQLIFGTIFESCTEFGVIITDPNNIGVNVLGFQDPTCPDSCDGRIFTNIGGGTGTLNILWIESGSTQASPTGVCTGINTVEVTDANGCFFTQQVTVDDPSQINFGMVIQDVSCDGVCDAQATSTPSGSNGGPFNFTWTELSGGTGIGGASGLPSHTQGALCENESYLLEIEDVDGCPFDTTISIPDVLPMTLSQDASTDATCFNTCDGSITISISGGSGNYTQVEWVEGTIAAPVGTHDAGPSLFQNDLCPNTDYFVIVTDDQGCTRSFQLTPVSAPPALVFSETHDDVTCNGDDDGSIDITLTGGTPGYNFTWSYVIPGSGLTPGNGDQTGLSGGTYRIVYEDNLGCTDSADIVIFEPDPIFTNGVVTDVSCFDLTDGEIDVTTTGGNGTFIWTWTSTPNGNIVDPTLEDQTGLDSAIYFLNITDALGCTYDTSFNLIKPGELFFGATVTDMDCFGDNDAQIDLNPFNGVPNYTIDWNTPINQTNGPTSQSGLSAGTYDITLTDNNNCDKDTSIVIIEPPLLELTETSHTDISCFGFDDGEILLNLVGGTAPTTVVWTGGSTAIPNDELNPTGLGPGTYTATVTDNNNCTDNVVINIDEPLPLEIAITGTDLTCNGIPNGAVDITPSGGVIAVDYTFDWDTDPRGDFDDAEDLSGLLAGTYCVNIQDDNGCTLTADSCFTIIEPDSIFFDGSFHTDITCNGDDDGTIDITVTGGTEAGTYDFNWNPVPACYAGSTTNEDLSNLCPGDYTVTATDDNGCTNDTTFTIIEPNALSISETHVDLTCADANTGEITITTSGGALPLTVTWTSNTGTTPATDELNPTGLEPGDYTATVTDANSCSEFVNITITTPTPLSLTITGTDLTCNGVPDGTMTIVPTGGTVAADYTYSWTGPNGYTSIQQNLTSLLAGTYCVNIEDDNGCTLATDSCFTIIEPDSIFFDGSTFTDMDCFGADNGAITLNVSGGTEAGTYDFIWGPIPACASDPGNVGNASGLCDGSYTIQAIDDNGCTNDTTFTVTEPTEITLVLDSTDAGCGLSNGSVTVTPSGGTVAGAYGISWTGAVAGFIGNNLTETGLDPDTYTVVVTDDNGCTATDNIEVITDTPPIITIDNITDLLCNSVCTGAVQTTITSTNPPYNVQWTGITDPSYSSTSEDIFNLCAGDYSITVTDANLCTAVETVTIGEPTPLELSSTSVTQIDCFGADNGAIDITAAGGTVAGSYIYTWTGDNSFTSSLEDVSGLAPGNYCVNIQDDNGCSFAADSCFVITEPTELVIDNLSSTDSQCGVPNGSATVVASGGTVAGNYGYLWDDGSAQTTATATGLINNAYTVIVTDDNGCTVSGTVAVNPTNGPAVVVDGFTDVTCNGSANGTISVTGSGGTGVLSYTWSTVDGSGLVVSDEDQTGLSGGTYVVTVTDGALCNSQEVIVLNEPDAIVITEAITDANCFGENGLVDITVTGGTVAVDYGYDWDNNGTGAYIDPEDLAAPAGTYNIDVVDDNGCPASAGPFTINEPTEITLTTSSTTSACTQSTGSVTVVAADGTPGTPPNEYTYVWTDASTAQVGNTATVNGLPSGCYDVVVTENRPNGCTATTTECISDNPGPTLSETHIDATCNGGSDGSIDLTIVSTAMPVNVTWSALGGSSISPSINDEDINTLAADEYSVTATDNNGCTAALSVIITEPNAISIDAIVTNPLCASSTDGEIDITVNDAVLPLSVVSWTGPNGFTSTSEDITGLEVGQYCLHIEDANSCTLDTCITLTAPSGVTVATSSVDSDCSAPTGQVSAVASGGNPGYTYEWFSDAGLTISIGTGDTQTGLGAGIYYVEATDLNGCTGTAQEEVFESNAPSVVVDATNDVDCFGNSTGDIFITVSGGTPIYTFDWDNDGTGDTDDPEDLTGVIAGTYNVTVTDAAGCSAVEVATIGEPTAPLGITGVQTDLTCNGVATGEVTITVTGGTTDYTYEWSESGNIISTATDGTGTNTVTGLSALVYDVLVTDNNGCTITDQYTLAEPTAISLTMGSIGSSCGNSDGEVSVTATGGTDGITYTYDWDIDGTGDNDDNATETGLAAATYSVTVTDLNGCTATDLVAVSDVGGPTVTGTASSVNCFGDANGTVDITVTGNPTFDFAWSGPGGFTSTLEDISALEAGTYTVAVTDINNCITNEIYDVTGPAAPLAVTMDSTDLACFEDMSGAINITPTGGTSPYQFSWTGPNGFTATTEDLNSLEAGIYTVDITDDNGCTLLSNAIEVVQPDSLEITFAIADPGCGLTDGTVTATVIGGTVATDYSYVWTDLGGPTVMPDTDADITNIGAGNYQLDITDDNGCTQTDVAAVSNDLAPNITVTSTDVTCNGFDDGSIDITVNGTNTYTYDWDHNGTGAYTDTEDLTGLAPGTYNVEVLEDPTGCISTATATIVEPDVLAITGTGADLACFEDGTGAIDITVTGGTLNYTFDWDNDGTGDADDAEDLNGLAAGTYQITVEDANGCLAVDAYTLIEPAQIDIAAVVTDNQCNGETNGAIDVTVTNGVLPYQYAWDLPSANEDLSNLGAGTYTLTVTDGNTCTEDSTFTITEPNAIIFDVTTVDANCTFSDGSATSNVSGGTLTSPDYTYDWQFGGASIAATADITNQPAGTYIFYVTDDNSCTEDTTIVINNINAPTITLDNVTDVTCFGDSDGAIDVTVTGGTLPYTYIWNPNGISQQEDLSGAPADTYTLQVTDDAGCISTLAGVVIDTPDELTSTSVSVDATCGVCNGEATITGTGGTGNLSYVWSNGDTGTQGTGLCSGIYTVEITDDNGCSVNEDVTINDIGGPTGENLTTTDATCAGDNDGTAFVEAIGGTAPYSYFWPHDGSTGDTQNTLAAGSYNVEMIDDNGCIRVVPVEILEPTPITISSVVTPSTCGNADGAITITTSGGVSPLTINWITPATGGANPGVNGLTAGIYEVQVTDNNGCSVNEVITISDINAPVVTLSPTDALCNGDATGSISSSVSGAVGSLSYQWYDATPAMIGGETNADILNVSTGDYTLEVTDAGTGCVTNATTAVDEPDALILSIPNTVDASCDISCDGEATAVVSGGTLGYSYSWSTGATSATATNLCVGLNTVTITDNNGCMIQTSVLIDTNFTLNATVAATDATCGDCNGEATVTAGGGSGSYSILWSDGTSGFTASNLCSGFYPFEVTDNTTGCSVQLDATINDIGGPTGETINVTDVTCNGGTDGFIEVIPTGGTAPYSYNWVNQSNTTNTFNNAYAGNYLLQVFDDNGCQRNVPVTVSEPDGADIQYIATDGTCGNADGSISIIVTGSNDPYTFLWTAGPSAVGSVNDAESGLLPGVYTIEITDAVGCVESINIPLGTTNGPSLTMSSTDESCFGLADGEGSVVATGNNPFNYSWTSGGNADIETGLTEGQYFVTVTDALGCVSNGSVQIDGPDQLVLGAPSTTDASCDIACDGEATVILSGGTLGYTYTWDGGQTSQTATGLCVGVNNVNITDANGCEIQTSVTIDFNNQLSSTVAETDAACGLCDGEATVTGTGGSGNYTITWYDGATGATHTGLCAGIYPYTLLDNTNGCATDLEATINNIDGPDNDVVTVTDVTCGGGADGSADVTVTGGTLPYTYLWVPTGQTTNVLTNVPAGTYNLEVSDSNDCKRVVPVTIADGNTIDINYISTGSNCGASDGSIDLMITGGVTPYMISWSGPGGFTAMSQSETGLAPGIYTIDVTDNNGCTESIMIPLSTTNPPTATVTPSDVTCFGAADGSLTATGAGLDFEWQDGSTNATLNGVGIGEYFVTATDPGTGCSAVFSGVVNEPDSLALGIQFAIDPLCSGDCNGEVSAIVDGGTLPYSYGWSSSTNTAATESGLCDGVVTLTITDNNGCTTSGDVTLTAPSAITIVVDNITDAQCVNSQDGAVDITATGGTGTLQYSWVTIPASGFTSNSEDIAGLDPTTYEVTVTDDNGCTAVETADVDTITVVLANAGLDTSFCLNNCAVLTGSFSAPVTPTYEWNTAPATAVVSTADTVEVCPLSDGTTQMTLTVSALNCSHTDTVNVTVHPLPVVDAGADIEDVLSTTQTLGGSPTGPTGSTYFWTPNTNFISVNDTSASNPDIELLEEMDYYVFVTDSNGCMNSDTIHVRPIPQIVFPNGFTPNADGINDDWQIDYIDQFPESVVEVYNRWGEMLFRSVGYTERWDGTYNGSDLPVGTYYYIIELNDPLFPETYSGPVTIMR